MTTANDSVSNQHRMFVNSLEKNEKNKHTVTLTVDEVDLTFLW